MRKFVFLMALYIVVSCDATTIILDVNDPRLPAYTETGNNIAAAYLNNEVWRTKEVNCPAFPNPCFNSVSITVNETSNITNIKFFGANNNPDFQINIVEPNINSAEDVLKFEGRSFGIDNITNTVVFTDQVSCPGKGVFNIDKISEDVFAGTFYITVNADANCNGRNLTNGRFDFSTAIDGTIRVE